MIQISHTIVVATINQEIFFDIPILGRPTLGPCKCVQNVSGHKFGLWHLGRGKFVDYSWLLQWILRWRGGGDPIHNEHAGRAQLMRQLGVETVLDRRQLNKAALGFKSRIRFDDMSVFCLSQL